MANMTISDSGLANMFSGLSGALAGPSAGQLIAADQARVQTNGYQLDNKGKQQKLDEAARLAAAQKGIADLLSNPEALNTPAGRAALAAFAPALGVDGMKAMPGFGLGTESFVNPGSITGPDLSNVAVATGTQTYGNTPSGMADTLANAVTLGQQSQDGQNLRNAADNVATGQRQDTVNSTNLSTGAAANTAASGRQDSVNAQNQTQSLADILSREKIAAAGDASAQEIARIQAQGKVDTAGVTGGLKASGATDKGIVVNTKEVELIGKAVENSVKLKFPGATLPPELLDQITTLATDLYHHGRDSKAAIEKAIETAGLHTQDPGTYSGGFFGMGQGKDPATVVNTTPLLPQPGVAQAPALTVQSSAPLSEQTPTPDVPTAPVGAKGMGAVDPKKLPPIAQATHKNADGSYQTIDPQGQVHPLTDGDTLVNSATGEHLVFNGGFWFPA